MVDVGLRPLRNFTLPNRRSPYATLFDLADPSRRWPTYPEELCPVSAVKPQTVRGSRQRRSREKVHSLSLVSLDIAYGVTYTVDVKGSDQVERLPGFHNRKANEELGRRIHWRVHNAIRCYGTQFGSR